MNWLYIGLVAYFLNAISFVVSKVILTDILPDAWTYTFYVNALGIFVLLLVPFGFAVPALPVIAAAIASGVTYTFALLILYKLLAKDEASQVVPLTGGLTPIFVLLMAILFLSEVLSIGQAVGFVLIVIGGFIAAHEGTVKGKLRYSEAKLFWGSVLSALLFGASQVLLKFVFDQVPFLNGFIWRGFGAVVGAAILLAPAGPRKRILASFKSSTKKTEAAFIAAQGAALASFVMANYAISIGPVSLVNALSGVQYAFLFGIIVFLSKQFPKLLKEPLNPGVVRQKIWSILLITIGVFALFI
ncbi:EamA family transporter [Patescibacteria group bacterium]|nr:EamA family transporter [Patescibacteria group bacterium]